MAYLTIFDADSAIRWLSADRNDLLSSYQLNVDQVGSWRTRLIADPLPVIIMIERLLDKMTSAERRSIRSYIRVRRKRMRDTASDNNHVLVGVTVGTWHKLRLMQSEASDMGDDNITIDNLITVALGI